MNEAFLPNYSRFAEKAVRTESRGEKGRKGQSKQGHAAESNIKVNSAEIGWGSASWTSTALSLSCPSAAGPCPGSSAGSIRLCNVPADFQNSFYKKRLSKMTVSNPETLKKNGASMDF